MELEESIKKVIRYSTVQNILRHYECPDTCGSHCCSKGTIHVFEGEQKRLIVLDPEKAQKIEKDILIPNMYHMKAPCSFLNKTGRCDAYIKRPLVCGLYPFKVLTSQEEIGLQPCPVGFEVIREFVAWIIGHISNKDLPSAEKEKLIIDWKNNIASYAAELKNFHTNGTIKELQIPFDELEMFSMFLALKKASQQ